MSDELEAALENLAATMNKRQEQDAENRIRELFSAALARAEQAEKERDAWRSVAGQLWIYSHHNATCDLVCKDYAVCNCGYEQIDDKYLALAFANHALTKGQQP